MAMQGLLTFRGLRRNDWTSEDLNLLVISSIPIDIHFCSPTNDQAVNTDFPVGL